MAYNPKLFEEEAKPRRLALAEKEVPVLSAEDNILNFLNRNHNVMSRLGIVPGKDGSFEAGTTKDGSLPRLFITGKAQDGSEKLMSLDEAGIKYGSREFWHQAQMGNLFGMAAGRKDPVQISLNFSGGAPKVSFSDTKGKLPDPPLKPKPSMFQRFTHWLNRNWNKKVVEDYDKQQAELKSMQTQLDKAVKSRKPDEELKAMRGYEKSLEAERLQAEKEEKARSLRENVRNKQQGAQNYKDMTAPTPVFNPTYERINSGPNEKMGFYDKETFSQLEKLDKSYADFTVGGQIVSEDEYNGLVAGASVDDKYADASFKKSAEYDPQLKGIMISNGISPEKATKYVGTAMMTMVTIDIMKHDLRNNEDKHFECTINPARKDTMQALESYKAGNKEPLAKIIANGVYQAAGTTSMRQNDIKDGFYNYYRFTGSAASLLDRDPELKNIAMEKYGMKEADLKAVKSLAELDKADTARREAKAALAEADAKGVELSREQKEKYAKDIVKANLMESRLIEENISNERDIRKGVLPKPEHDKKIEYLRDQSIENDILVKNERLPRESRPKPPQGLYYSDQVRMLISGSEVEYNTHPKCIVDMGQPDQLKSYDKLAQQIVENDNLADMKVSDLNSTLGSRKMNGNDLLLHGEEVIKVQAQKQVQAQPLPQVQKQGPGLGTAIQ